jgi:threonine dehydrogenase-like Zn-dependent dehydrogenase
MATAYRMLFGHRPHVLRPGQNVLVWGASGGLGSMAVQLIAVSGANAIGVISEDDKRDFVRQLGAKGVINRKNFKCWGQMPAVNTDEYNTWFKEVRKFGAAIWEHTGKGNNVDLRGETRRHGGSLRRNNGLQSHPGRPLSLDASEAPARFALRQFVAGESGQSPCD